VEEMVIVELTQLVVEAGLMLKKHPFLLAQELLIL
jgi:hypothetical protein